MKRLDPLSWFMIFGAVLMAILFGCSKDPGHHCKFDKCPYKGVTADLVHKSVVAYTGEAYTDAYCIDMLHLQYPAEEYDQLEERLNKINN